MSQLRKRRLEELQPRDYSQSTARIYLHVISDFAKHFRRSPDTLGPEHIRRYQVHLFHGENSDLAETVYLDVPPGRQWPTRLKVSRTWSRTTFSL
jgi:hypothetical protein